MPLPPALAPLRHRDFRLLWAGQTLSWAGNFLSSVAYPFQVLALGGSALELGIALGLESAGGLLFLLVGGVVTDRLPRRAVLIATDALSALLLFTLAGLGAAGVLRIEHLYVLAPIFGATFAFVYPAIQAIMPELVPADVLVASNALRAFSRQAARLAGPAAGGILVATSGPPLAFAVDGLTFVASLVTFALMRPAARPRSGSRSTFLHEVAEGFRYTFSTTWLWVIIVLFTFGNFFSSAAQAVGIPLFVTGELGGGAPLYGLFFTAIGIGEVATSFVLAQTRIRRSGIAMSLFVGIACLAYLGYALSGSAAVLLAFAALSGVSFVGFGVLWDSALQRHVPREILGRVASVDGLGSFLLLPLGPVVGGALIPFVGPRALFLAAAVGWAGVCLIALSVRSVRRLE